MMNTSSTATQATSSAIPAGLVLPYAGTYSDTLVGPGGWLPCDGRLLTSDPSTQALFAAIGTASGGTGATFNLPDCRGVFLRGVSGKASTDPDSDSRVAVAPGGAYGNNVGSFQPYATALPAAEPGIQVSAAHLPTTWHHAYAAGVAGKVADWDRTGDYVAASSAGGDRESRPQNLYVDFIIQSMMLKGDAPTLPAGVLVGWTGVTAPAGWLLCDGKLLASASYPDLYAAIGTCHGGTSGSFNLPDLRGRLLRGRTGAGPRDPDAATRAAAAPGGNTANAVGSVQADATGKPVKPFTATLAHCPLAGSDAGQCLGNHEAAWTDGSTSLPFNGTWDRETRPVNLNVDWYVKVDAKSATLPVGSIVAVAGNASPGPTWLPCDGGECKVKDYPELFAVIGTLNGGDGSTYFNVPDCRGRFLRGVDRGAHRDPDASARTAAASGGQGGDNPGSIQGFATKAPATALTAAVPHLPTGASVDTAAGALTGVKAAASTGAVTSVAARGGDKETRPVNLYVAFYVKAKSG
jgi:microcystin-dependent protein